MRTGIASFGLDWGTCPKWLFERMVRLARVIGVAVIREFGPEDFLRRMSDPVWFQSFGSVLAFDWNASGLTTTTMAALKEAFRGYEKNLGVFVCGGKGATSRKTPLQIGNWGDRLLLPRSLISDLVYASRASAKVDSSLVQDGFTIYHHNLIFTPKGKWVVIQQGMNLKYQAARRYHWLGEGIEDFVEEPHSGIASQIKAARTLDLTAKTSAANRLAQVEIIKDPQRFERDIKVLTLPNYEFKAHPVENLKLTPQLEMGLEKAILAKPTNFERMLMTPGVGGRTIRALSLVAEVIHGAKPSYEDPARYTFAHGGKDGTPYPVDRKTYDSTLEVMERALSKSYLPLQDKKSAYQRAVKMYS